MLLFVDNLTNVDFSYLCPKRGLLGETWLAHIELTGPLDAQGMVCDFGIVKKILRQWLDTHVDHCLLVPSKHQGTSITKVNGQTEVTFPLDTNAYQAAHSANQAISTKGPEQAITLIDASAITPEAVAQWCEGQLNALFGEDVSHISLRFTPENIQGPYYHYSHGLKKHGGNCQRIAHGHRSTLKIWKNQQEDAALVQEWVNTFSDIYIGTREDIKTATRTTLSFAYTSQQGNFELTLPRHQCYIIDTDTTVELIAQHIVNTLKNEEPDAHFRVKAFEGIGKGAIAE